VAKHAARTEMRARRGDQTSPQDSFGHGRDGRLALESAGFVSHDLSSQADAVDGALAENGFFAQHDTAGALASDKGKVGQLGALRQTSFGESFQDLGSDYDR